MKDRIIVCLIILFILAMVMSFIPRYTRDESVQFIEFSNIGELQVWLYLDNVSSNIYINDTYDCDDFAIDLVDNARRDGYKIYMLAYDNHAYCVTHINGKWYKIEPQSDLVSRTYLD